VKQVLQIVLLLVILCGQRQVKAQDAESSVALRKAIAAVAHTELTNFHANRAIRLRSLKLDHVLKRKNPYLFRAKKITSAAQFVDSILNAHVSSQEEGVFGGVLERIALEVSAGAYGGRKSGIEGVDLEFESGTTKYLVSIKSGPNWGNSSQIRRMRSDFQKARRTLGTNTNAAAGKVVAVNGCCYGTTATEDKGDYLKLCGQKFWQLLSGHAECYQWVMQALDVQKAEAETDFNKALDTKRNELTEEFGERFCAEDATIQWSSLLEFNSAQKK
jgi:hypothetical protein